MQSFRRSLISKRLTLSMFNVLRRVKTLAEEKTRITKDDVQSDDIQKTPYVRHDEHTNVTLITRSEAGNQAATYVKAVVDQIHAPISLEEIYTTDTNLPEEVLLSAQRNGNVLYLDLQTAKQSQAKDQRVWMMNTKLDLFACVANLFSIPGYAPKNLPADIAVIMQNNRGDHSKLEYTPVKGLVESLKISEATMIRRCIEYAFNYATNNGRQSITFGHKLNELPLSDGMVLGVAKAVGRNYPQIIFQEMPVNTIIRNIMWHPSQFDVICLSDNFGLPVLSAASGICGGAGLFSVSEIGKDFAVFKPLQTKLSISDVETLCPYGVISALVSLLHHVGYHDCASKLWKALAKVMVVEKIKTKEFGGKHTEEDIIHALLKVFRKST